MTERKFFAFFGVCCAAALAFLGLMVCTAYLVTLLPEDTPARLESAGLIVASESEDISQNGGTPSGEYQTEESVSRAEESAPEARAVVTLDLSRGGGKIYIQNETAYAVDPAGYFSLPNAAGDITGVQPTVLVFHTHGTESYAEGGTYTENADFRSTDITRNVVAAGEALCDALRQYGIFAVHDLNMYDEGDFSAAYSKSRAATEEWLKKYPSIRYVLDIHRDSVESGGAAAAATAVIEDKRAAQIMIVVGTDERAGRHTGWERNFSLAVKLQTALQEISPRLARPIYLRSASFNQDISPGALLIEIGSGGSTLAEAEYSASLLARAMAECFSAGG